jgi:transcriptional regulator with XRE-family HTH domain
MRSSVDPAELGEFIREQRRIARLSVRKLSELAGVSNPYLSQIERGLRKPSADILQALAKGLRISAETLYVRAGLIDKSDVDPTDLTGAILEQSHLSDEQKHTLITMYRTFRELNASVATDDVHDGSADDSVKLDDASTQGSRSTPDVDVDDEAV